MVLEAVYELDGVYAGVVFWLRNDRNPGGDGEEENLRMNHLFDVPRQSLESAVVMKRRLFMDWHGRDSADWRPESMKRYPERPLITDERLRAKVAAAKSLFVTGRRPEPFPGCRLPLA